MCYKSTAVTPVSVTNLHLLPQYVLPTAVKCYQSTPHQLPVTSKCYQSTTVTPVSVSTHVTPVSVTATSVTPVSVTNLHLLPQYVLQIYSCYPSKCYQSTPVTLVSVTYTCYPSKCYQSTPVTPVSVTNLHLLPHLHLLPQ